MRTMKFLLFILLSFTVTCAWADLLPRPAPRPAPRPPIPPPASDQAPGPASGSASGQDTVRTAYPEAASEIGASMASADVKVRIRKDKAGRKRSMLVADVSGEFDIVCSAASEGLKDLDVVFPVGYEDEKLSTPVRFDVVVDGKRASHVERDTWSVTDEHNRPRAQQGYAWRLPGLKAGQKRRISVRYSIVLPQNQGKAHFIYFLRSGARWDGPIGREVVNISARQGIADGSSKPDRAHAGAKVRYFHHLENHESQTRRRHSACDCVRCQTIKGT